MGMAPLDGVKVLEIATTVAGPAAGRILADFGADVFKLEAPDGDHLRSWGERAPDGTSWWFKSHNRNKRFVAFDLHIPSEVAEVRRFALECDVLIENFRPGRLAAWGLGYEELAAVRPDLIYVSISGYGQDGPYASRPGFGHIAESMSGVRYVTGYPDLPPVRVGLSIGDEIAGMYAALGTLLALRARDAGGGGDHVDVSLVESLFSLTEGLLPDYQHAGVISERMGNRYLRAAPSGTYATKDGKFVSIAANSGPTFKRLCDVLEQPELASDPRFDSNPNRVANVVAIDASIESWTSTVDLDEALSRLHAASVPAGIVASIADIVADPQMQARGAVTTVSDECGGSIATPGLVPRLLRHPGRLGHAARAIGADQAAFTAEIAGEVSPT